MNYYRKCDKAEADISVMRDPSNDVIERYFVKEVEHKQIVDLSKIVGSHVLCEFSDNGGSWMIGKLDRTCLANPGFRESSGYIFEHCRIYQGWQAWVEPGDCPLPKGVAYEVMVADSIQGKAVTDFRKINLESTGPCWRWEKTRVQIVAYKPTGLLPNYRYSWEGE